MHLHSETLHHSGQGLQHQPVVMLHGWGMHSGLWGHFAQALARQHPVTLIDLPGHGHSRLADAKFSLNTITQAVKPMLDRPGNGNVLLGWSLGGLIAMQLAAMFPALVSKLVLIATNARFTRNRDWPWALQDTLLEQFSKQLLLDHNATLQRFLALQVRNSDNERRLLCQLKQLLASRPAPQQSALTSGLQLLQAIDLRSALKKIQCPVLLIHGSHDRIVPADAGRELQARLPNAGLLTITGAGHAPFLSHSQTLSTAVDRFIHD